MKYVINDCYGGFKLSRAALEFLGIEYTYDLLYTTVAGNQNIYKVQSPIIKDDNLYSALTSNVVYRSHPELIRCIQVLGSKKASALNSKLIIVEQPDWVDVELQDNDGFEFLVIKNVLGTPLKCAHCATVTFSAKINCELKCSACGAPLEFRIIQPQEHTLPLRSCLPKKQTLLSFINSKLQLLRG